jgi:hypothetical protein
MVGEIRAILCAPPRPHSIQVLKTFKPSEHGEPSLQHSWHEAEKRHTQKSMTATLNIFGFVTNFAYMLGCALVLPFTHRILHVYWQTVDEWKAQFAASDKKARGALTFDEFRRAVRK